MFSNKLYLQLAVIWAATARILHGQTSAQPGPAAPQMSDAGCVTGPTMQDSNSIFVNGRQYLSDSGEVECNGIVTAWYFCHYVIGFRLVDMAIWAGAWRLKDDFYELVGLNVIKVDAPGYGGEQLRCMDIQLKASEWFDVQEGDYTGFYLPDNGVFVASASTQSDPEHRQMQRNIYGYAANFNASEVERAASSFGRALLRATINSTVERPSIIPSQPPVRSDDVSPSLSLSPTSSPAPPLPPTLQTTIVRRQSDSDPVLKIVIPVIALIIILALLGIIAVLIILLRRRRAPVTTLHQLPHPLCIAVDATNPTTDTTENGSVLYEAIYSQAYLQARNVSSSDVGYSMISNPAYRKGSASIGRGSLPDISPATSPPVCNPAYAATAGKRTSSLVRYPPVVFKSRKSSTLSSCPLSPPPSTPAPECPAPPPPPLPYVSPSSSSSPPSRPPTLPLVEERPPSAVTSPVKSPVTSPASPYSNPYKTPRLHSPTSIYETPVPPQTLSASSTMTCASEQSSGDTQSGGSTVSTSTTDIDNTAQ